VSFNSRQPLVGRRLRGLREQLGLTRAELSKHTGVTTSAIVRLEGGQDVRLSTYFPIIEYFAARDPWASGLVERLVLLPEARRAHAWALLDHELEESSGC
jgi:transcriptional regulator with XRE-family HTH domain